MEFRSITQIPWKFYNAELYNPTITDLSQIFKEEEMFFFVLKMFHISFKDVIITNVEASEFKIFQTLLLTDQIIEGFTQEKKESIIEFLHLIFKDYKMDVINNSFMFKKEGNFCIIDETNFEEFKKNVSQMFAAEDFFDGSSEKQSFNPVNEKAKAIAEKINQGRKKVAEEKNTELKKGIIDNYISILSNGFKIPPKILSDNLTFYNLINQYKRLINEIAWDLDIKQRLAGGNPQDSPESWLKLK